MNSIMDWDSVYTSVQPYATFTAGIIFGAGWWALADAVVFSAVVLQQAFNLVYLLPGLVATLALGLMNLTGREEVSSSSYLDDAALFRSRFLLAMSYVVSLGAVAGSVAVLLSLQQQGKDLAIGVSSVLQTCLTLASGMICWFFQMSSEDSGGYLYM